MTTTSNVLAPPLVPFSGMVMYPFLLVAGADLLDRPAVAIRVVEVDEPDVVEGLAFAGRALGPPSGSCQDDGGYPVLSRPSWSKAVGEVHDLYSAFTPLALSAPLLRVERIQISATAACRTNATANDTTNSVPNRFSSDRPC